MTFSETVRSNDFRYHSTCYCGGMKTERYRRGDLEMSVRKSAMTFRVKQNGHLICLWTSISKLESFLNGFPKPVPQKNAMAH